MKVLVDLPSRLGDLVVDIAVMQTLVKGLGDCTVEVVMNGNMAGLVEDCTFIHKRHFYGYGKFVQQIMANVAAVSSEWDVYLQMHKRGPLRWSRPWLRSLAHRPAPDRADGTASAQEKNIWDHRLSVLNGLVANHMDELETRIPLLDGRAEHSQRIFGIEPGMRYMTVAPGSDHGRLPWPANRACQVIEKIKGDFDRVLVLGRAENGMLCRRVAEASGSTAVAGSLPFPYAIALVSKASLHIGSDNGMAQAAAAFGVNTLSVGGPRDGYLCPWKQHQLAGSPEDIDTDEIVAKVGQITK